MSDIEWDRIPLTEHRATALSRQTGLPVERLAGRTQLELDPDLRFRIEPELLFHRRIRGRVVRTNPATGLPEPVPGATVHVEDTDYRFLGYFPIGHPWCWLLPLDGVRETIATVVTDRCGRFSVYVPRWEIDWILRRRWGRWCHLVRPTPPAVPPVWPVEPPFPGPVPPPLAGDDLDPVQWRPVLDGLRGMDVRGVDLRPERFVGPFLSRPELVAGPWAPVLDVPDITFRVTQDVDGDGAEEVIYQEGFFDIRWDAGTIPDVTLVAAESALSVPSCDAPDLPCDDRAPVIRTVGLMSVEAPYHDPCTGYALRTNQPRPGGLASSPRSLPASTPYCRTLQLHGCHHLDGAAWYRLLHSFDGGAARPFTGLRWWAPRLAGGTPIEVASDADGWLPVLPADQVVFPHWLLNWETTGHASGRHRVTVEVADSERAVLATSCAVEFVVDNTGPTAGMAVRWRRVGTPGWTDLPDRCPVIRRGGHDVEIEVGWHAAARHLLRAALFAVGCDAVPLARVGSTPGDHEHWHTSASDNAVSATARFLLGRDRPTGAYTFGVDAISRAYNPAGEDAGPGTDFVLDRGIIGAHPRQAVAIVE
jgi:hypothetical protein